MRPTVNTASLGRWVDPADAWAALCSGQDAAFWLDSGATATAGVSYVGVGARLTTEFRVPVLDWLRRETFEADTSAVASGFALGWVGWLGYELRGETLDVEVNRVSRYPDAAWLFVDRCLAFDHGTGEVTLLALGDVQGYRAEVEAALFAVSSREPTTAQPDGESPTVEWAYTDAEYLSMIDSCQAAIIEGEAYQLCLTTEARVDVHPDPFTTYLALRASSPTHHGALLVAGGIAVLSATPEQFLAVSPNGVVQTKPIKGTRARGANPEADAELKRELESSEKERAENLMIVDLMRNDIGRISAIGSVTVTDLMVVESYAQVHQLVSTVQGVLAEGLTAIDAIEACFPAGSMTGAPKRSTTQILDRLEARARGIYSGAFGYLGLDGALDLAMVIRSIVIDANGCTVGAGGGITALSVPAEELAEAKLKAAALLSVLGVVD